MAVRSVHEQLKRLLSAAEQKELRLAEVFAPFAGLHPLQYNPYTQPLWKAAVTQYNRTLEPAESRTASKLKQQLRGLEQYPLQVNR